LAASENRAIGFVRQVNRTNGSAFAAIRKILEQARGDSCLKNAA
jgi:hypothetical protein